MLMSRTSKEPRLFDTVLCEHKCVEDMSEDEWSPTELGKLLARYMVQKMKEAENAGKSLPSVRASLWLSVFKSFIFDKLMSGKLHCQNSKPQNLVRSQQADCLQVCPPNLLDAVETLPDGYHKAILFELFEKFHWHVCSNQGWVSWFRNCC